MKSRLVIAALTASMALTVGAGATLGAPTDPCPGNGNLALVAMFPPDQAYSGPGDKNENGLICVIGRNGEVVKATDDKII